MGWVSAHYQIYKTHCTSKPFARQGVRIYGIKGEKIPASPRIAGIATLHDDLSIRVRHIHSTKRN